MSDGITDMHREQEAEERKRREGRNNLREQLTGRIESEYDKRENQIPLNTGRVRGYLSPKPVCLLCVHGTETDGYPSCRIDMRRLVSSQEAATTGCKDFAARKDIMHGCNVCQYSGYRRLNRNPVPSDSEAVEGMSEYCFKTFAPLSTQFEVGCPYKGMNVGDVIIKDREERIELRDLRKFKEIGELYNKYMQALN
jgi:hypothetical protein